MAGGEIYVMRLFYYVLGARGQYVDVFAGSGMKTSATAPSSLFNVMPQTTPQVPANIFVPSGG